MGVTLMDTASIYKGRLGMRRVLMLAFVVVLIFAPAVALAMSHCAGMMSAVCQGPCASYACESAPVPLVGAPVEVDSVLVASIDHVADPTLGTPEPPPRPLLHSA